MKKKYYDEHLVIVETDIYIHQVFLLWYKYNFSSESIRLIVSGLSNPNIFYFITTRFLGNKLKRHIDTPQGMCVFAAWKQSG